MCNNHDFLEKDTYQIIDAATRRPHYMTNCFTLLYETLNQLNSRVDAQRATKGIVTAVPRYTSTGPHAATGNAQARAGGR